jgi:hypothetical protein
VLAAPPYPFWLLAVSPVAFPPSFFEPRPIRPQRHCSWNLGPCDGATVCLQQCSGKVGLRTPLRVAFRKSLHHPHAASPEPHLPQLADTFDWAYAQTNASWMYSQFEMYADAVVPTGVIMLQHELLQGASH